jgi:Zn-dependent protease/CBS domain-containing protein
MNSGERSKNEPAPPWTLRIATVAGIPIRIHASFLLLVAFASFTVDRTRILPMVLFLAAIFACVILHELGHSLVALRYGIPVSQITLYPIGGIANIDKRPTPKQELWIALAGPAVNVLISGLLWLAVPHKWITASGFTFDVATAHGFIVGLLVANVSLAVFNMIPAFPMDGGRVLRSILAQFMKEDRATVLAAQVGQVLAAGFALFALTHKLYFLLITAYFVYSSAAAEVAFYRETMLASGLLVRQAMLTRMSTLSVGDTLKQAADLLLDTTQHDFPVLHGDSVTGILTRKDLLSGLASIGPNGYVAGSMDRDPITAGPEDDLVEALNTMSDQDGPLLVVDPANGHLMGMVTADNVQELFAVRKIAAATAGISQS